MSRLKKEKIKATMSGLALMIAIGVAGGVGSYAYFTDQSEAKNDLVVTMGELDIDIPNSKEWNHDIGKTYDRQEIYIDNNGTLNQNVKLTIDNFKVNDTLSEEILKEINYQIEFKYVNRNQEEIDKIIYLNGEDLSKGIEQGKTLIELNGKSGYLKDDKGELITLSPGEYIKCTMATDITGANKELIQNKTITFDTNADGFQLGGAN